MASTTKSGTDGECITMALKITNSCFACYACETVCLSEAITVEENAFIINPALCSECDDIESPRCIAICPEPKAITSN